MVARALDGVKVLDLATLFPAPLLAAMLGDLGADVVKVEPTEGDALRRVGAMRDGQSSGMGACMSQQAQRRARSRELPPASRHSSR